jgi:hypothetical protein
LSTINYIADGYELLKKDSPNMQSVWICLFNPTKHDADLRATFYYEEQEPTQTKLQVPSECRRTLHTADCKEIVKNKRYGVRILSTEPIVVQSTVGYYEPEDKRDWYTRGMTSTLSAIALSKVWYYADGIIIDQPNQRLKESEWAFVLNPNKKDTTVTFTAYYDDQTSDSFKFTAPTERLKIVFLDDILPKNKSYGARLVSTEPIVVQEVREIWEEDRILKRTAFSVMSFPWPLRWGDEIEEIL